jgi:hypothetical protein
MASPLDRPAYGGGDEGLDPRMVAKMKQRGIWHPAMVYPPTSRQGRAEAQIMDSIQSELAREDAGEARASAFQENLALRKDAATARQDVLREAEAGRSERAQTRAELSKQAEQDRVTQGLIQGITAASYMQEAGKPIQQTLMNEYMKRLGIQPTATTTTTKPMGEYGVGGGVNPAPAPTPGTTPAPTPGATPQPQFGTYQQVAQQQGYAQPTAAFAPPQQQQQFVAPQGTTVANALPNAPAGYDFNVNTGEYILQSAPQFINGQQFPGTAPLPPVSPVATAPAGIQPMVQPPQQQQKKQPTAAERFMSFWLMP